jgi:hypothetical protein
MNDEYSRLKARYRQTRSEEVIVFLSTWDWGPEASEKSDRLRQELADFCVASGIDREDLQQFLAEVDQEMAASLPQ